MIPPMAVNRGEFLGERNRGATGPTGPAGMGVAGLGHTGPTGPSGEGGGGSVIPLEHWDEAYADDVGILGTAVASGGVAQFAPASQPVQMYVTAPNGHYLLYASAEIATVAGVTGRAVARLWNEVSGGVYAQASGPDAAGTAHATNGIRPGIEEVFDAATVADWTWQFFVSQHFHWGGGDIAFELQYTILPVTAETGNVIRVRNQRIFLVRIAEWEPS